MMNNQSDRPWGVTQPLPPIRRFLFSGKQERRFLAVLAVTVLLLANSILAGGFNLGFAVGAALVLITGFVYSLRSGGRLTAYTFILAILCLVMAASFARSDDALVKFVLYGFLATAADLTLCLMAGQERCEPGGAATLADAVRCSTVFAVGSVGRAFLGLRRSRREGERTGRGELLLGLLLAVPVLAILLPLLRSADAAFAGLLARLPEIRWNEIVGTLILGAILLTVFYTRSVALAKEPKGERTAGVRRGRLPGVTVTTVLLLVCLVYGSYLISQLAYFTDAFSGLLPAGFTTAEYARRGFFEMTVICCVNLWLIAMARAMTRELSVTGKVLCLFIGAVTLFLVCSAAGRMALYIGSFGLTRLRVLTMVIMVFAGLTAAVVSLWLFMPKLPYMKVVIVLALILGCAVCWADVDTQVARYNVEAYRAGQLETVDVEHLSTLSGGAVPYLAELLEDRDPEIADQAREALRRKGEEYGILEWKCLENGDEVCAGYMVCLPRKANDPRAWNQTGRAAYELLYELAASGRLAE